MFFFKMLIFHHKSIIVELAQKKSGKNDHPDVFDLDNKHSLKSRINELTDPVMITEIERLKTKVRIQ